MNAITVMPIQLPVYCNINVRDREQWLFDNAQTLLEYWEALGASDPEPVPVEDFCLFGFVQYERELDRMDELKRCYGSTREA